MDQPVVMKFGGTSVGSAAAMSQTAAIIAARAREGRPLAVVVSAMSGITDALLAAANDAKRGDDAAVDAHMSRIEGRHEDAISQLFAAHRCDPLRRYVSGVCSDVRAVLTSVAVLRELTPRGEDRIAAAGELMSSRMIAALLDEQGVAARWIDARRAVITDSRFGAALPVDATRAAIAREVGAALAEGAAAVLGGFIGATADGITTTLGRGGSDYSAAIVGAALDACEIQIWTDVDGMLTADPRVVPDAQVVPQLSFEEASELAYFGAKVLHPSTILPALEKNIPVRILNTMRPRNAGTVITAANESPRRSLAAIACKRNVTVVDVTSTRMLLAHGFLHRVFEIFERHQTSVDVVTTSEVSVSMTLDDDRSIEKIERDLSEFATVRVEPGMAIVSAVGDPLRAEPALAVSIIAAFGRLPLRMVSQAASRRNVTVVLNDADVPAAMSRLHAEFFAIAGAPA
jgi:aspartate kinase